jgi:hypothetical protein
MSLAAVQMSKSDVQRIVEHLHSHPNGYRNMHMRQTCVREEEPRALRYLHAMCAHGDVIEGAMSGPGIFWRYTLTHDQLSVDIPIAPPRESRRIYRRFRAEIMQRIEQEKESREEPEHFPPNYKPGQYYLRRDHQGTPVTHRACVAAVTGGALAREFVALLKDWKFELRLAQ